ncbi:MAG: S41 family peptidase [Planctomycetota bacterium]
MDGCPRFSARLQGGCQSLRQRLFCILSLSLCLVVSQPLLAQNSSSLESARRSSGGFESLDSLDKVFVEGESLERDGKWADALSLYQTALKKQPNDQSLIQRRSLARIHYDLGRRYGDTSFLNQINRTAPAQAQNAYAEVLLKIQSYYVDIPDWDRLTRCGLMDLQIALHNKHFREAHLPNLSDTQLNEVLAGLAKTLDQTTVKQRTDSVMVANHTAEYLQEHLGLPVAATIYEFVSGAMAALDPYSSYMSESQYGETMSQIEGNFVGLGVELKTHNDRLEIVNVISGGPASQGGLRPGDNILAIDNVSVSETGSEKAADNLRGPDGSIVTLDIKRDEQPIQPLQLQRRKVEIPSVDESGLVDRANGIGYIRLTNFQKTTSRDFDAALWKLQREGMRSLIVDVRGNPGGLLTAAVEVADRFVYDGVIVSTKGRNPLEDFTHRAEQPGTWRVPLVVLVDEDSASASEIFAAAIRDHKRGVVVGYQSYGKGSVQGIFPLNIGGGGVRLTTAKFFSPNGNAISQIGVTPDIPVEVVSKPATSTFSSAADADAALQVGISIARREAQTAFAGR